MVEEWFNQCRVSWEALETALREACAQVQNDGTSSESTSDAVDSSCVKKGNSKTSNYIVHFYWYLWRVGNCGLRCCYINF